MTRSVLASLLCGTALALVPAPAANAVPPPSGCYDVLVSAPTVGQHPSVSVCLPADGPT